MIYWELFLSFLQVGLFSFGGGYAAMPLIRGQVVTVHHWLSMSEFTDLITISQMTPGPIAVNSATFVGTKIAGTLGALVATFGCILPSCIIVTVSVSYTWQGGEPTLRGLDFFRKALYLQKKYNRNHLQVINAFQTNGYGITDDWCMFFKENKFLVGVSVDGLPEIHDSIRHNKIGDGTFEQINKNIKLLDKYNVEYNILTVVTPKVAKNIKSIYAFYKQRGWHYQQYIACLDPYGEEHGKMSYSILPEQYGKFLVELFKLWYKDLQEGCHPYIRQFENYVGLAAGYMAESCEQRGKCGVQYVVEADGSVYPCDFFVMDKFYLGNLNTDIISKIDEKRKEVGFIECSERVNQKCKNCTYYRLCRGGCMRNRELGDKEYLNYFCEGYQIFFEHCYEEILKLGDRVNYR